MLLTVGRGLNKFARNAPASVSSLKNTLSSCVFDLDVTKTESYNGTGQIWQNLVAVPADGSARSDYDFYVGTNGSAATNDPAFTGTAGNAAAYWSFDAGDWFDPVSVPTSTYLRNIHRTDASRPVTIGFAFRTGATLVQCRLFATANSSANHGISFRMNTNGSMESLQSNGSGSFDQKVILGSSSLAINTNYLLLVAFNAGSTGSEKRWLNTSTGSNWSGTFAPLTSSTSSSGACIGAQTGHSNALGNGYRLYGAYMFNEIIDNTKAASIISVLNARHGRTYA